jgi:hypothetical protein
MSAQPAITVSLHHGRYPVRWRPVATATWLQHRAVLITGSVLLAGTALAITANALGPRGTGTNTLDLVSIVLLAVPVLIGMFVGAPMLLEFLSYAAVASQVGRPPGISPGCR